MTNYPNPGQDPYGAYQQPATPPVPKKSHKGLKIVGGIGAAFVALMIVAGVSCGSDEDTTAVASTSEARPTVAVPAPAPSWPPTTKAVAPTTVYTPPAPAVAPTQDKPKASSSQQNAVGKAKSYLKYSAFSRTGLIHQLEYEEFSNADATYAVDSLNTDWDQQAVLKAKEYLKYSSFSKSGLIGQLEYEGFTSAQAQHGADVAY